ncbi:cell wall hydrolase [Aurantiacibacter gilvus]|uniref:Cell wall hydrolase n=1 Tax=Aurantiacibacter gilvus TaxID=3139141 RepID=A0ABU9IB56_9SPHN
MLRTVLSRLYGSHSGLWRLLIGGVALAFLSAPSVPVSLDIYFAGRVVPQEEATALANELSAFTVQGEALIDQDALSAQERNADIPLAARLSDHMAPFRSISTQSASYSTALDCLTEAVYYEAANESTLGKRGVAQVILNRVAHPAYPSSVCGVIYQGSSDPVCQFSYTCDGALARRPLANLWQQSREVARAALNGYVEESVGTSTHYHADYVLPYWAYRLEKVHVEGRHIFYRLPGTAGRSANFMERWNGREYKPAFNPERFAQVDADIIDGEADDNIAAGLPRDITDRRAEYDVGGRLDTSTGWRLSIPDPTTASTSYRAALEDQQVETASPQVAGAIQP